MNAAQIIITVLFTYCAGAMLSTSDYNKPLDEVILWPIYFIKWILKALWKSLTSW